jgi:hypothetical protein
MTNAGTARHSTNAAGKCDDLRFESNGMLNQAFQRRRSEFCHMQSCPVPGKRRDPFISGGIALNGHVFRDKPYKKFTAGDSFLV